MTNINSLLSELVVIANDLDSDHPDISADVDAAIFIMSAENALPRNKSLATVVRENFAAVADLEEDAIEDLAVTSAEEITELLDEVLAQRDPRAIVSVLTSLSQSLRSVLHPNGTMSKDVATKGANFLVSAETKLSQDESLHAIGYRVGLVRSNIEKI